MRIIAENEITVKRRNKTPKSLYPLSYIIFTHFKLCLATASHNLKWLKITHICLIWESKLLIFYAYSHILFPITVIWSAKKAIKKDYCRD